MKRERGFTLLEVLVAILIGAIALTALASAAGDATRNAAALRESTYGYLVASNQLAELRARRAWPATGQSQGSSDLAERRWEWRAEVADTDDPAIRKLTISVLAADGHEVAKLTGYLGRPTGG